MTYSVEEPPHIVALRDTLRRFVERELPREAVRHWDRQRNFPIDVFRKLAGLGVCGLTIAEEYGGAGRDLVAAIVTIDELARRRHCRAVYPLRLLRRHQHQRARLGGAEARLAAETCARRNSVRLRPVRARRRRRLGERHDRRTAVRRWQFGDLERRQALVHRRAVRRLHSLPGEVRSRGAALSEPVFRSGAARHARHHHPGYRPHRLALRGHDRCFLRQRGRAGREHPRREGGMEQGMAAARRAGARRRKARNHRYRLWHRRGSRGRCLGLRPRAKAIRQADLFAPVGAPCSRRSQDKAAGLPAHDLPRRRAGRRRCAVQRRNLDGQTFCRRYCGRDRARLQRVMGAYGCAEGYDMERYVRDICVMPIVGGSSNMQKNNIAARLRLPE